MNVLSLFDGMSCGHQALDRAGIKVSKYFASEIDKYAIKVTQANYPDTIQLGTVVDIDPDSLPEINLLIGGSPCQSFSFAGKRTGMSTKDEQEILTLEHYLELKSAGFEFEGESYLFWEYMRILTELRKQNPQIKFLLENVKMGDKWETILSKAIGCHPIEINSALVSAQSRRRLYWTNINEKPYGLFGDLMIDIPQPKDKGILLKHILQENVPEKYFLSDKMHLWLQEHSNKKKLEGCGFNFQPKQLHEKSNTINQRMNKMGVDDNYIMCVAMRGRNPQNPGSRKTGIELEQTLEQRGDEKTNTLTSVQKDNLVLFSFENSDDHEAEGCESGKYIKKNLRDTNEKGNALQASSYKGNQSNGTTLIPIENDITIVSGTLRTHKDGEGFREVMSGKGATLPARAREDGSGQNVVAINERIRRLTPVECERLQTVNDNYTDHVSDTQRYKMIGNGWTVDVIAYIFSYLKFEL